MGKDLKDSQKTSSNDQSEPLRTLKLPSAEAGMLSNLYGNGQMVETERACRELLQTYPRAVFVFHMLGAALIGQGKLEEAVQMYIEAIRLKPDYVEAHCNLGVALSKLRRFEAASESYQAAIGLNPKLADAYTNYGAALRELGRFEDALTSYNKAIQLEPSFVNAFSNRGLVLEKLGRDREAIKSYNKAIELKPDFADAYHHRGLLLLDLGLANKSFASIKKAVSLDPTNDAYWYSFAQCFQRVKFSSYSKKLDNYLTKILGHPKVSPREISTPAFTALRLHPIVSNVLELSSRGSIDKNIGHITSEMSRIPLLLNLMKLAPVTKVDLEKMLTTLRKAMLCEAINGSGQIQGLPFYSALALLCFFNDYVFFESNTEINEVKILENVIKDELGKGVAVSPLLITVLASYRPLNNFSWITELLETDCADEIKEVIVQQVINVREEENIRLSIPRLTSIDTASVEVKNQYEENPYPRWSKAGLNPTPETLMEALRDSNLHLNLNGHPISDKPNILVAGCGTGQHAVNVASSYRNSNILAVDLSLTSLSYAKRKTQELGLKNIEYMQADILKLSELEREFDLIECGGVLHHLEEPLAGWRILTDRLRKGGVMHIGLYSERARQYVVQARQLIKERGLTGSPADIRRFREILMELSADSQLETSKALGMNDFYNLSECRDLLFHVLEHRFTLPQLKKALKELDLQFLGFSPNTNLRWAIKKFTELHSQRDAALSLSLWHKFELKYPDTFRGMYDFWVQK